MPQDTVPRRKVRAVVQVFHAGFVHNGLKLETTIYLQISTDGWIILQLVLQFNGILFRNKKEKTIDTCDNIDESEKHVEQKSEAQRIYNEWLIPFICSSSIG